MTSTENKFEESEERFKALFKASPVPTYAWQKVGESFKLIDYNNAANIITQGYVQNHLGSKASEMNRERLDILEDLNSCFEQKTTIDREMKYFFSSIKEEKDLLVKYVFLPPDLVLVHTEDITERKRAEEKIQYQAKLVEDVSDAIISTDLDFKVITWNKAAELIYGWKAEEAFGKSLNDIIPIEYPYDEQEDVLKKFFEEGFWKGEVIQKHKDGTPINILASVSLIKDIKGNQVGAVAINRDISERKLAEQKLRESGQKYCKLFNNAPFAIVLFNIEGIILDCNNATETITGYNKEELIGNNFKSFNFYVDMKLTDLEGRQIQTSSGNVPKPREVLLYRKDRSQFLGRIHIEFIQMREKTYIQAIIHDITKQKQSTIKLHDSELRLKERVKELNFLFEISKVAEDQDLSTNEIIRETVNLIPYAWQFPNILCTHIIYDDKEFESDNFKETKWTISTQIDINEKPMDIEIFYQEEKPFLKEEENLIVEIGNRLKIIIEKKISVVALALERQFTEDIINSSVDTIFVFDPETRKAYRWNKAFNDVSGYTDEEISKMKAPDSFYNEEDLKRASEAAKEALKEGTTTVEMSLITKNGKRIPYEYTGTTFKSSDGKILIVSVGRDITERKEAERKLKESEKKYHEAYNRANFYRDLFAHDINNILQVITSSAELISLQLEDYEKGKDIKNIANIIRKHVQKGAKLVENVRTLTELEKGDQIIEPIEVISELKNSIKFIQSAYSERKVDIHIDAFANMLSVQANELLQEIFDNILINAVKYNENSNVEIQIKITKEPNESKNLIKMEFLDNGIGINDDKKEILFKEGYRKLKGSKGMGLGLSLVSKILKSLNGKIWVEDRVKGDYTKGSNFIIELPE